MTKSRIYTQDELILVYNVNLSAREVSVSLGVSPITIDRLRKKLNILVPLGAKTGRIVLKTRKRFIKECMAENCTNTFETVPRKNKRFCSPSCQLKTIHIAPKGRGSRGIRNPNTKEYKRYSRLVHSLSQETYIKNIDSINPNRHPRTLCGIDGGWQLDHIKTIKECFQQGIPAAEASVLDNLRMLPWRDNLMRQYNDTKT